MNKKILTIDDLIKFCEINNFQHFSAENDDVALCVQIPSKITMSNASENYTEGLRPFTAKAYHDNINLNHSKIKKETLESTLPSATLRPILANIVENETGEKDFGSHDFYSETDENGNERIVYKEQPVGVIFGDNAIEYDEDADVDRAILHGYLYEDYCQDAIDILDRRGSTDCSVELNIRELSYNTKEKVLELEDFYVGGLTLLGSTVKPGMAGSNLTLDNFSKQNNSVLNYSETDNTKLIETLEKLNTILSNFNINQNNQANAEDENPKEGGNQVENNDEIKVQNEEVTEVEKTDEVENAEVTAETEEESTEEVTETTTENESEETVDTPEVEVNEDMDEKSITEEVVEKESIEEVKVEEEIKETEACGGGSKSGSGSGKKKKKHSIESEDGTIETYEVSLDEKIYAIQDLVNATYSEADNTYYGVKVYEKEVVMLDYWSGRAYKQSYTSEEDSYILTGDRVEVYATYVTAEEQAALDEMKSNYAVLEQFKEDTENAQLHSQREAILADEKYAIIAEKEVNVDGKEIYKNESFAKLVSEMDNYSLIDLEKEVKSVFADYITDGGKFDLHTEEVKPSVTKKIFASSTKKTPSRYGNLFSK